MDFTDSDLAKLVDTGVLNNDSSDHILQTKTLMDGVAVCKEGLIRLVKPAINKYVSEMKEQISLHGVKSKEKQADIFERVFKKVAPERISQDKLLSIYGSTENITNATHYLSYLVKYYAMFIAYITDKACKTVIVIPKLSSYTKTVLLKMVENVPDISFWSPTNIDRVMYKDDILERVIVDIAFGYIKSCMFMGPGKIIKKLTTTTTATTAEISNPIPVHSDPIIAEIPPEIGEEEKLLRELRAMESMAEADDMKMHSKAAMTADEEAAAEETASTILTIQPSIVSTDSPPSDNNNESDESDESDDSDDSGDSDDSHESHESHESHDIKDIKDIKDVIDVIDVIDVVDPDISSGSVIKEYGGGEKDLKLKISKSKSPSESSAAMKSKYEAKKKQFKQELMELKEQMKNEKRKMKEEEKK